MEPALSPNNDQLPLYLEWAFLTIAAISTFTCLIRTDYNFAFALLCYYLWHSYREKDDMKDHIAKQIFYLNCFTSGLDLIWLLVMGHIWGQTPKSGDWEGLESIHTFGIFLSSVNFILKLGVCGFLYMKYRDAITS